MKKSKKVFIVVLIIIIAILAWRLSLFIRARILEEKIVANFQRDYYRKTLFYPHNTTIEEWYGEKYSRMGFASENGQEEFDSTMDIWQDNENRIIIHEQENKRMDVFYLKEGEDPMVINIFEGDNVSVLTNWNWEGIKYSFNNGYFVDALQQILVMPLTIIDEISTVTIDGKECYAVKETYGFESAITYYIEKDTNLIIRLESYSRYGETTITNYEYSFEPITKESIEFPNLEEYYVIAN